MRGARVTTAEVVGATNSRRPIRQTTRSGCKPALFQLAGAVAYALAGAAAGAIQLNSGPHFERAAGHGDACGVLMARYEKVPDVMIA